MLESTLDNKFNISDIDKTVFRFYLDLGRFLMFRDGENF